ncbi:uncharacterized protein LOC111396725 [Olea europaea subsp. europaea]|uniref:Uncharacterized protein LOC111396725 n=1 Tax=Olea europaea subsp. europaea TaxID=158383 RepID=A0A8S0SFW6_OLEEU|nr:uncharacterized protein LOC111396725 [Olea europaea subsp. europaea]
MLVLKSTVNAYRNIPAAVAVLQALRGLSTIDNVLPTLLEEGVHQSYPKGQNVDGAHDGDFRAKVWSMSGGLYCRPKHWKQNATFAMFGIILFCIWIAMKSAELEQRPHLPVRSIPSQLWCKNFRNKEY